MVRGTVSHHRSASNPAVQLQSAGPPVHAEAERDASGRIIGLRGTAQDVTDRRLAERTLRENEERLRIAAQAGRMFAYTWDVASDIIVRSGESAEILGIDEATSLTGREAVERIHPDDRDAVVAAVGALTPTQPRLQVCYRLIRPDSSVMWVERTSRAYFDDDGKILRVIGMVADITLRRRAEEALSAVSQRLIEAQEAERARIARDLHDDFGQRLALLRVALDQWQSISGDSESESIRHMADMLNQITEL